MVEEVDGQTQAEMALKLTENVRELIRQELALALQDSTYLYSITVYNLVHRIAPDIVASTPFQTSLKEFLANQMRK